MIPNVLFVLYCLIALPIFFSSRSFSGYSIGLFIGQSIIPIILIVIYNIKKDNKKVKITTIIGIILWTLITVFAYLGKKESSTTGSSSPIQTAMPSVPVENQTNYPGSMSSDNFKETRTEALRDFSHALIGHWETIDGKVQEYISADEIISNAPGRFLTYEYIVLLQSPAERTIEIRIEVKGNNDFNTINDRKFIFSDDYKIADVQSRLDLSKLMKSDDPNKFEYRQDKSMRYVDSKQKP